MIGQGYWATGIVIDHIWDTDGGWAVWLDFLDNGFAEDGSTEGVLRVRYLVNIEELPRSIRTLKEDAERLGIKWCARPTVYAKGDKRDLQPEADHQAELVGWHKCYEELHAFRSEPKPIDAPLPRTSPR